MGSIEEAYDVGEPLRYGFIGLGVMGWGMANNLRSKVPETASLCVCEISKERLVKWVAQSPGPVSVANTPKEVIEQSVSQQAPMLRSFILTSTGQDIIITMLPAGPHVAAVFTDPETGLLSADPSHLTNKLFLECSTIDIDTSLRMEAEVKKYQAGTFIDSPVSGGVHGANTGTLSMMVGCDDPSLFEHIKHILSLMGAPQKIFHCGGPSAGLATKQINNYLSCITMLGTCEAMTLGQRSGLDPVKLASVIKVSTGACYNCAEQNPVRGVSDVSSAAKDFEAGFTTEMAKGVLDMALSHGGKVGAKSVLGGVVSDFYAHAASSPVCQGKDYRSIYKLFSENDGKDLGLDWH